jgi:hypothetical protein
MSAPPIVELADRRTWPVRFRELADAVVSRGSLEDQWWDGDIDDDAFVAALDGRLLRTYHCTRLTPNEIAWVRAEGLHPLSPELVRRKVFQAVEDGHLTRDEGDLYTRAHLGSRPNRAAVICLVGDRADLSDIPGLGWLLSLWGGEGINMAVSTRDPESKRLKNVGIPSVVVALIDPSTEVSYSHPGIGLAAARRVAGDEPGTEFRVNRTINPDRIEAIHHPGSPFWDRYVRWSPP